MENKLSPYSPPSSQVETSAEIKWEVVPASKWLRFANSLIDYVGYMLLCVVIGVAIALIFGEEGLSYIESVPEIVVGTPIFLTYYIFLEGLTGRTIGKLITGTRVVNESGLKPTFGQILGRSFSRIIPFEAFSFLGGEGRGWHDSLAKTYVVKCR